MTQPQENAANVIREANVFLASQPVLPVVKQVVAGIYESERLVLLSILDSDAPLNAKAEAAKRLVEIEPTAMTDSILARLA